MVAPSAISGLVGWFKASSIVGLASGDPIPSWPDNSPSGVNAVQAVAASRPVYRPTSGPNGMPCVDFDGVDDFLVANIAATSAANTVFIVASALSDAGAERCYVYWRSDGNQIPLQITRRGTVGVLQVDTRNSAGALVNVPFTFPAAVSVPAVLTGKGGAVGGSINSYINGTAAGGGSGALVGSGSTTSTLVALGGMSTSPTNYGYGSFGNVRLSEVVMYNKVLSDVERAQVHSYLQDTYAITVSDYIASGSYSGPGAVSGSGSVSGSGVAAFSAGYTGSGAVSGSGSVSGVGAPAVAIPGSTGGSGTVAAVSAPAVSRSGTVSGSGTVSAAGALSTSVPGSLGGSGAATGTGQPTTGTAPSVSGTGTVAGTGTGGQVATGAGSTTGTGSVSATGVGRAVAFGSGAVSGSGTVSGGSTLVTLNGFAALSGTGTLAPSAVTQTMGLAATSGTGTLTGTGWLATTRAGSVTGSGTLSAVGRASSLVVLDLRLTTLRLGFRHAAPRFSFRHGQPTFEGR